MDSATASDSLNVSLIVLQGDVSSIAFPSYFVLSPQRSPFMERIAGLSLGRGVVHHLKLTPEQQLLEDASPS